VTSHSGQSLRPDRSRRAAPLLPALPTTRPPAVSRGGASPVPTTSLLIPDQRNPAGGGRAVLAPPYSAALFPHLAAAGDEILCSRALVLCSCSRGMRPPLLLPKRCRRPLVSSSFASRCDWSSERYDVLAKSARDSSSSPTHRWVR
jgi:hypothetical protein